MWEWFTITLLYVTRVPKMTTHGLTSCMWWRKKLLFAHRPNSRANVVETTSIWDTCKTPTAHHNIDEIVKRRTKTFVANMNVAYILTIGIAYKSGKQLIDGPWYFFFQISRLCRWWHFITATLLHTVLLTPNMKSMVSKEALEPLTTAGNTLEHIRKCSWDTCSNAAAKR
jgi:hypothetical protein